MFDNNWKMFMRFFAAWRRFLDFCEIYETVEGQHINSTEP